MTATFVAAASAQALPLPERKPTPVADAPADAVPLPQRRPKDPGSAAPLHPSEVATEAWSEEEVAQAASACVELLRDLSIVFEHQAPIREGRCGTPAPVRVTAVGTDPAVAIVPAALLTCPLAATLARWVEQTLQPVARAQLGSPVVRLRNASDYVCRNRYGAPAARLSEHARVNALDISAFETASGEIVSVLHHWDSVQEAPPPLPERSPPPPARPPLPIQEAVQKVSLANGDGRRAEPAPAAARKVAGSAAAQARRHDRRALFLRRIHREACGPFGTVLGPDANAAHADHFHFDGAARRSSAFCE